MEPSAWLDTRKTAPEALFFGHAVPWIGAELEKEQAQAIARPVDLSNQEDTTRRVYWLIMCYSGQRRARQSSLRHRGEEILWSKSSQNDVMDVPI